MPAFMRLGVLPDVVLPPSPPDPPPPRMAKRPAGINAFLQTVTTYDLKRARLAAFAQPVLFVLGGQSNPDDYAEVADGRKQLTSAEGARPIGSWPATAERSGSAAPPRSRHTTRNMPLRASSVPAGFDMKRS
ncbi:MAG: hypothetical protein M3536_03200 [Actinomycetota bacterium]|nr:hypothetical protein [Actinomycetota bacterium]